MKTMGLVVCSLVGVALIGCPAPPTAGSVHAVASVAAPASAAAPALPARSYRRGPRAYAVVDEAGPFSRQVSISPDGLLVALIPANSPTVVFYDVDRRRIVGRAESASAILLSDAPLWLDDAHLLVSSGLFEALYDSRFGTLVGQIANGVHAAIATKSGFATLAKGDSGDTAELLLFADPTRKLARIRIDGYIRAAYDFGDGAFAYLGPRGLYAFEPDGKPRWQRAGEFEDVTLGGQLPDGAVRLALKQRALTFSLRDGKELSSEARQPSMEPGDAAGQRLTIGEAGLFERSPSGTGDTPSLRFRPGTESRLIEPSGGVSFAARCDNGATATLGAATSRPPAFAPESASSGGEEQSLVSEDGAYRVVWTPEKVTLSEVASKKASVLDVGKWAAQVAFHPNGKSLITAAHWMAVGMGWHPDPDASVRVFDLASGLLSKKFSGNGFRLSDDKTKLVILGSEEATLYDATSYQKLRSWRGIDNEVSLDPAGRFAFVKTHERPAGGMGPHETKEAFVEELATRRRVIGLKSPDGYFAFDDAGSRFAFATPDGEYVSAVAVYDLASGKVNATVRVEEQMSRLAFLGGGKILAIWTQTGLVLHRLADGRRVTVYAVPEAQKCRLFAVDDQAHFQGEPGTKLAFRYGDDLRTSEVVAANAEPARADDRMLEKLFAGP